MKTRNIAFQSELFDITSSVARLEYCQAVDDSLVDVSELDLRYLLLLIYSSDPSPLLRSCADHFRHCLNDSVRLDNRMPPVIDNSKAAN